MSEVKRKRRGRPSCPMLSAEPPVRVMSTFGDVTCWRTGRWRVYLSGYRWDDKRNMTHRPPKGHVRSASRRLLTSRTVQRHVRWRFPRTESR
jgi:hypothetical protein